VNRLFPIYYAGNTVSKVVDQDEKDISHECSIAFYSARTMYRKIGVFTLDRPDSLSYLSPQKMKPAVLLVSLLSFCMVAHAQVDSWVKFTIKIGGCHGVKPATVTVLARKSTLKSFMQKEGVHFDNCNYLLESPEQIIEGAASSPPPPGDPGDDKHVWVKDPGEFVELYKREKAAKNVTGEICVNTDREVSFTIGTEDAKIGISTNGKISLSAKSADGTTRSAEL